jgi:hypothetical protein
MSDILESIQKALADRTSVPALAILLGAVTLLALGALRAIEWVVTSLNMVAEPIEGGTRAVVVVLVLLVLWLATAVLWLFWRSVPTVRHSAAGILFATAADEEVQALVHRLQKATIELIAQHGFASLVRVYVLPKNRVIGTAEDARRALDIAGARLMVWGKVASGTIRGRLVSGFKSINFTFSFRPLNPEQLASFQSAFTPALLGRKWLFAEGETFFGLDLVAANVGEVAIFALALGLATDGELSSAACLLGQLRQLVFSRPPSQRRDEDFLRFSDVVRESLLSVRYRQLTEFYQREFVDHILDRNADAVAEECQRLVDECVGLASVPEAFDLAKSTLAFHFGRTEQAKAFVDSARRRFPGDPAPFLSLAFLALWKGDYSRVAQYYRQAEKRGPFGVEMLFPVVRFLQAVHDRCPARHEVLFALAVVNEHLDRGLARQDFEAFLAATPGQEHLQPLRDEAERRRAALE